jgi:hypothetical protein
MTFFLQGFHIKLLEEKILHFPLLLHFSFFIMNSLLLKIDQYDGVENT